MKIPFPFYNVEYKLNTVKDVIDICLNTYKDAPVFVYKKGGDIKEKSKDEFVEDVNRIGNMFHQHFGRGKHIAILGKTSYEWICCYFAAMNSENIAIPLDKEMLCEEVLELVDLADVDCLVYDDEYFDIAKYIKDYSRKRIAYICMQGESDDRSLWDMLKEENESVWEGQPRKDDIAEIIFTSGTMGKRKGCMITHESLAINAMNGSSFVLMKPGERVMSVLPINHALEMAAGIMTQFCNGVTICISESIKYFAKNLLTFQPSGMVVVPLIMEMMYKNIWKEIEKKNKAKQVKITMKLSWLLYKCHIDIRRKVFSSIISSFGGNLRIMVVGGAYISPEIIKDFETWGINIVQGYGITECGPIISCNTDRCQKWNSVGKIATGISLKIVDKEIWVKGPVVMKGYYNDTEETSKVLEGEWFKTGDLGYLDNDDFLYLVGRKKNLIILSNGKNVVPEELERIIMRISYVKEVIVSEKDGIIQAELFLDKEEYNAEKKIKEEILKINRNLPNYKKIIRVVIREMEFEKTTTKKIKRSY